MDDLRKTIKCGKDTRTIMVSQFEFWAYEKVRNSGLTNMFGINNVIKLSGLSRDQVLLIMERYGAFIKAYGRSESEAK